MPPTRVLVVDDDPKFRDLAVQGLVESGLDAAAVANARDAETAIRDSSFDVVMLDVMMPGRDGTELLRDLRARGEMIPVLLVTARGQVEERVDGLRLGADDYVVKPFAFAELIARIEVAVRGSRSRSNLAFGAISVDAVSRTATCAGRDVDLSPKEFDLLRALVLARGDVASRCTLLRNVWKTEIDPGTNVIDVHIARLRRKLEAAGGASIETLRGVGYRLRGAGA